MKPSPDDIRDIRGPIAIPYWWIHLAEGVAVVLAIAAIYGIYRAIRRYRKTHAKTFAQIALERIERARQLLTTHSSAEFSAEVSDAVRAYIEARFSLRASHRTTEEFLRDLLDTSSSPIASHRDALEEFLSWCDLAKFARLAVSTENANAVTVAARQFVEVTS
ncbi:MAG: DUF4381 family protein [Polyangiaceae bacterium]